MKIDESLIKILAAAETEGNILKLTTQLDRITYQKINKVLTAVGGKWNSSKKAHVFKEPVEEIIQNIILTGGYTNEKQEFQFFPTPKTLAKKLVEMSGVCKSDICLEPSAGQGNIAEFLPNVDVIELNPNNRKILEEKGFNIIHDDFMTFTPKKEYDVIVMNPPFCKQQDVDHITKAVSIAKKAVVAVSSAGVMFRKDKKTTKFRELVASLGGTIEELPESSFKESGTAVNTCVIRIHK